MSDDCVRRGKRGILGVPYPKNDRRLFSFTPVQGDEWPSSDDSDEDFNIKDYSKGSDSEEGVNTPSKRTLVSKKKSSKKASATKSRTKGKKKKKTKYKKYTNNKEAEVKDPNNEHDVDFTSWGSLPLLIIQRVLHYAIQEDGAVPFLLRASQVSRSWQEAARSSVLWQHVNLDRTRVKLHKDRSKGLMFLVKNRFSRLERLNLSNWSTLNLATLETILKKCPTIKQLTLQGCNKLGSSCLTAIADECNSLVAVDIMGVALPAQCLTPQSVSHLLQTRGSQLEELVLAKNAFNKWPKVLDPIMSVNSMPHLRLLDLSNCQFRSRSTPEFPVESLHWAWPNLEVLLLSSCDLIGTKVEQHVKEASPGFPKLRELHFPSINMSFCQGNWQQKLIERILKGSIGLQFLDIRGRILYQSNFPENLPCTAVEHLYIGRCDQNVLPLVKKWSHSLATLEMANLITVGEDDGSSITSLLPSMATVKSLDLAGTDVDFSCVRKIFQHCKSLTELNLERCRNIDRGMKQNFWGQRLKEFAQKCSENADFGS